MKLLHVFNMASKAFEAETTFSMRRKCRGEYGSRAIKGGFADDEMKTLVGASRTTLGSEARSVWAAFLADSKSRLFLSFVG